MNDGARDLKEQVSEANRTYFDAIADSYEADPRQRYGLFGTNARRRYREVVATHRDVIGRGIAVNIACGTGNMMDIDRELGVATVGFDISPRMLDRARRYTSRLLVADFYRMPFRDTTVGFAAGLGLLHHVYDHPAFFAELHRVLVPGGVFYADYDPNYYAVAHIAGHRLLGPVWRAYERHSDRVREIDRRVDATTFALADYYAVKEPGLKREHLDHVIRTAGFTDVRVVAHSDGPSLAWPARGRLPHKIVEALLWASGEPAYERRAKNLAVLARKGQ